MSVQVAVRVRPFSQREIDLKTQLCIKMAGNQTTLLDISNPANDRQFIFDHSFWSHDGYMIDKDGVYHPKEDYYADQKKVFSTLGQGLLDNAWKGYHCTLFAYGQTSSGKSYSIMGYKPNLGIVPISCRQIFDRIQADPANEYEVNVGMMEIYNEKLHDLLIPVSHRTQAGMKIRESPTLGFYAEGLRKFPVRSFQEIEKRIEEGSKNRSIAATQMNAHSSRAHTIVYIELKQKLTVNGRKISRYSAINLVDLAGSEKNSKTGSTGDRLKEASAINKSLSMLGKVISTLADHAVGKNLNTKIPYRDSALTKVLRNALGGNSKTIMICAISPAWDNYDETLSTLRYADQAKKIKNKAIINESSTDKILRELKQENERLQQLVKELQQQIEAGFDPTNPEAIKKMQELQDIQENMNANQKMMEDQDKTVEEKLKELESERQLEVNVDKKKPYICNINEDPQLSFKVNYQFEKPVWNLGRKLKKGEQQPDIICSGLGIKPNHCQILNENGALFLVPGQDPQIPDNLFVNGEKVAKKVELMHHDRIIIGQSTAFLVKIPNGKPRQGSPKRQEDVNWDFVYDEQAKEYEKIKKVAQMEIQNELNQNMQEKLKAIEEKHKRELEEYQQKMKDQEEQLHFLKEENKGKVSGDIENQSLIQKEMQQANQKKHELEQQAKEVEVKYNEEKKKLKSQQTMQDMEAQREKQKLEKDLADMAPKVKAMNLMADELKRKLRFRVELRPEEEDKVKVVVNNRENNTKYTWDKNQANDRYYRMLDMIEQLDEEGEIQGYERGHVDLDPFMDYADPVKGGMGQLKLTPLLNREDIPMEILLYDDNTLKVNGILKVHLYETDANGEKNVAAENKGKQMDPKELLGKNMYLKVCIQQAKLPENVFNSFVEYKMFGKTYKTPVDTSNKNPVTYNYERVHLIRNIDDYTLNKIAKEDIFFNVCGQIDLTKAATFSAKRDHPSNFFQNFNKTHKTPKLSYTIYLFAFISLVLFFIQFITASVYRNSYEKLDDSQENMGIATLGQDHLAYWRAFSLMFITCIVMVTYFGITFLIQKCYYVYLLEFIYMSAVPAFVWFISSICWLSIDGEYQSYQTDIANDNQKGDLCDSESEAYSLYENFCKFGSRYVVLKNLTIFMLLLNTIVYSFYYYTVIKYFKQQGIEEKEAEIYAKQQAKKFRKIHHQSQGRFKPY